MSVPTTRRIVRNATIDATAAAYGPFTITGPVTFPRTGDKGVAWITNARGYNFVGMTTRDGVAVHTGATTVAYLIETGAITNPNAMPAGNGRTAGPVALPGAVSLPGTQVADPTDGYDLALAERV